MIIIAGPCAAESIEHAQYLSGAIKEITDKYDVDFYFKTSFDKANRTSVDSKRGMGMGKFIEFAVGYEGKLLTDVHESYQMYVSKFVDVVQIPAFLCRQTDLLVAAKEAAEYYNCIVNIKKGQFLSPQDMINVIGKVDKDRCWITERGTSFGYNTLVTDFKGIIWMRENLGVPVIYDATHSVQEPGGLGGKSGGKREYVAPLTRAAAAMGIDGIFMEVHENPDAERVISDGPNMVKLSNLDDIIYHIKEISDVCR